MSEWPRDNFPEDLSTWEHCVNQYATLKKRYEKLEDDNSRLRSLAKEVYDNMSHDWFIGHQDTTCPKCILGYALDDEESNDNR